MDWSDEKIDCQKQNTFDKGEGSCPRDEFRCDEGLCLPLSWTCDGQEDCQAGDDENKELCEGPSCDQFSCDDGSCVANSTLCDGTSDCEDGSDEKSDLCLVQSCQSGHGQFLCNDRLRASPAEEVEEVEDTWMRYLIAHTLGRSSHWLKVAEDQTYFVPSLTH